jgi:protein TonB
MFWLLWHLISQPIDTASMTEATRIQFTRQRRDSQIETKREERVEREPPPPTPQVPQMSFNTGGVSNNVVSINPTIDAAGAMSKLQLSAGSDTDVIPLVRIPPEYPPRALSRGLEGWVQIQFTITETGAVTDAKVIDAQPKNIFDEAALRSISRWRYNPKVENGVAVKRVGVQTIIRFVLEK